MKENIQFDPYYYDNDYYSSSEPLSETNIINALTSRPGEYGSTTDWSEFTIKKAENDDAQRLEEIREKLFKERNI
jgi:hypothetical protein